MVRNTLSQFAKSAKSLEAEKKVWGELVEEFEQIQPGIMKNL